MTSYMKHQPNKSLAGNLTRGRTWRWRIGMDISLNTSQDSQSSQRKSLKRSRGGSSQPINNLSAENVRELIPLDIFY